MYGLWIVVAKSYDKEQNYFVQLDEKIKSNITLGDGRTQEVSGKGTNTMKSKNSSSKYI